MPNAQRALLYIDMAYVTGTVKHRGHEHFFEARHSGGFFPRVFGVHPIADAAGKPAHRIELIRFSPRQLLIEGVAEACRLPRFLLPLNFLLSQAGLARFLARLIRRRGVSVITATDPYYSGLFGLILKRMTRRPLVVRIYANYDELYAATGALAMPRLMPFRWIEKAVSRLVLRHADVVTGGNRNNLDWAIANGARGRTTISPNARYIAHCHFTEPAQRPSPDPVLERLGIPTGRPMMLFVGRQIELKHPDDAVRAMAWAIERRPDAIGILAGEGPMRPELETLVESLGMRGRIFFAGLVSQEDLSILSPHCVTLSPLTGMALIECGLSGSPIVAYDRDWQTEFVEDEVSGFIVAFRDHEAMGRRALEILNDPDLARSLSGAIRRHALHLADKERIAREERQLYAELIGRDAAADGPDGGKG